MSLAKVATEFIIMHISAARKNTDFFIIVSFLIVIIFVVHHVSFVFVFRKSFVPFDIAKISRDLLSFQTFFAFSPHFVATHALTCDRGEKTLRNLSQKAQKGWFSYSHKPFMNDSCPICGHYM